MLCLVFKTINCATAGSWVLVMLKFILRFLVFKDPHEQSLLNCHHQGGTGEDRRIDPHLNIGNFIETNDNIWKKLVQIPTQIEKKFLILPQIKSVQLSLPFHQFYTLFSIKSLIHFLIYGNPKYSRVFERKIKYQ